MDRIQELVLYGTDKRQSALRSLFEKAGIPTHTPEGYFPADIRCCDERESDITILLPVPCSEDVLESLFERIASGATVIGGRLPAWFVHKCKLQKIHVYDYMTSSSVAIHNAVATAEGAICEAISTSPWNLFQNKCLVMGYGRCGSVLADRLHRLGAVVYVSARDPQKRACAEVMGHKIFRPATDLSDCYFVFNTIPAPVLDASILSGLPKSTVIIDIASAPGGCDFAYCKEHGIQAALYPALPAKYAPKSSAQIIFNHLNEIFEIG